MKAFSLFFVLLSFLAPAALAEPGAEDVLRQVFANFRVEFPAKQDCGKTKAQKVTVEQFVLQTLIYLAEDKNQRSWSDAGCKPVTVHSDLLTFYSKNDLYPAKLAGRLKKKMGKFVWKCQARWGHKEGENVWHREIQFLIDPENGTKAIPESFFCHYSP